MNRHFGYLLQPQKEPDVPWRNAKLPPYAPGKVILNAVHAYLIPDNYIDSDAGQVFAAVAKELILNSDYEDPETAKSEYPAFTARYDAFQMLSTR